MAMWDLYSQNIGVVISTTVDLIINCIENKPFHNPNAVKCDFVKYSDLKSAAEIFFTESNEGISHSDLFFRKDIIKKPSPNHTFTVATPHQSQVR
jgi:hypothetical protein